MFWLSTFLVCGSMWCVCVDVLMFDKLRGNVDCYWRGFVLVTGLFDACCGAPIGGFGL